MRSPYPEVARVLTQIGQLESALQYARSIHDNYGQMTAFSQIACRLSLAGDFGQANKIWIEILNFIESRRQEVLEEIASDPLKRRLFDIAHQSFVLVRSMRGVCCCLVEAGQFDRALQLAQSVAEVANLIQSKREEGIEGDSLYWSRTRPEPPLQNVRHQLAQSISDISLNLMQAGQFDPAIQLAQSIKVADQKAQVLGKIARKLLHEGKLDLAKDCWINALQTAKLIDADSQARVLKDVTRNLLEIGQVEPAKAILTEILDRFDSLSFSSHEYTPATVYIDRSMVGRDIGISLAQAGLFDQAIHAAEHAAGRFCADVLPAICSNLARAKQFEKAFQIALSIANTDKQAEAVREIVNNLAQAGQFCQALKNFEGQSIDTFISSLAQWSPVFEKVSLGLSAKVLVLVIGISGWTSPQLERIHNLLSLCSDKKDT